MQETLPREGIGKTCKKNTVVTRTKIVFKSKKIIFKNPSPRTSLRKDFFA